LLLLLLLLFPAVAYLYPTRQIGMSLPDWESSLGRASQRSESNMKLTAPARDQQIPAVLAYKRHACTLQHGTVMYRC
jgi:hypothetical protein